MSELDQLGFSDWFAERLDRDMAAVHDIARVASVHRESYTVTRGDGEVFAELSGNLLFRADSPEDLPTTGDFVYADFYDDDTHAIVHGILPRRTLLRRKTPGRSVEYQLLAANIDVAFVIQSLNENFNLRRLERYLVMVNEAGISPVVLLSKCDLLSAEEVAAAVSAVRGIAPHVQVIAFSNVDRRNLDAVMAFLAPGVTTCLLGSSGVGKTTLLNCVVGGDRYTTQGISKVQGKGRHTTTSRQLVRLDGGAMVIDTPGMRELGGIAVEEGLDETFAEIAELARGCRFSDCSHSGETGCAVGAAIEAGELSEGRYRNYVKMKKESAFNEMSRLERKKRDKSFGKMVKSVMKNKKR